MVAPELRLAWLVPDLAMVAACVTLFYCLFLLQGYRELFRDSDAGWHIRAGEQILATGRLPHTDPYSFTRAGQPWFAWEWGADVAVGAIHRASGLAGVALFYSAVIAGGVWMWFRLHWVLEGNFLLACAMAPLLLSTAGIHWLARPHVIGWLFLLGWVWWLERRQGQFDWKDLAFAAVFVALWANVHASFFLAPVIAAIYTLDSPLSLGERGFVLWPREWRAQAGPGAGGQGPGIVSFLRLVLVSSLAGLVNPYGWRLYDHVFRYLTDSDLLSRIGEFQTFRFGAPGTWQIIAAVMVGMIGGTLALTHRRFHHFTMAVVFTAMALRTARALPLAALLLLPIANGAITKSLSFERFLSYGARLREMDSRFRGWAVAPVVLFACFALLRTPGLRAATGFPPGQFPVAAYDHIPPDARLYAPDKFGGYLIYRSAGARKVFFDGRSDLYGAEFLKQYGRLNEARPGWQKYWNSFRFTHALVPDDSALIPALEQLGWKPIFHDNTATLLAGGGT
jgi:hypothetical protein